MSKKIEEKVEKAINNLLKMFETEELPAAIARTVINAKAGSDLPCLSWSLGNQLLTMLSGTTDARGFKQWEEVGRKVKKGAKAFYILGPCKKKITVKNRETEDTDEKYIITGFKAIAVFRYEDTEGPEIERPDYTPPTLPPLIEVAEKFGVSVKYGPFTKRFYGYYQPFRNEIMLCSHDIEIFFHEVAHAVHHSFKKLKGGQHKDQEIVAETAAAVLCSIYGYEGYLFHGYEYIKEYANANNGVGVVKEIMKVLGDVQKVLNIILNTSEAKENIA